MDVLLLGGAIGLSVSLVVLPSSNFCHDYLHLPPEHQSFSPLSISLGLSCCLFALSVLEATPSSWLLVLDNRIRGELDGRIDDGDSGDGFEGNGSEIWTVGYAYFVVLTTLSIYILVICPCMAGALLLEKLILRPNNFCNLLFCCCGCLTSKEKPLWLRMVTGLTSLAIQLVSVLYKVMTFIVTLIYLILQSCWRICFPRRQSTPKQRDSNSSMTLPLTSIDTNGNHNNSSSSDQSTTSNNNNSPRNNNNNNNPRLSILCLLKRFYQLLLLRGGTFVVGSVVGVTSIIAILHSIAPFIIEPKSEGNNLALALSWMCAIGIVVSTTLNGFGSVSMPHSCLAGLYLDPIRPETVTKATVDLQKTQESLQARREQLQNIRVHMQVSPKTNGGGGAGTTSNGTSNGTSSSSATSGFTSSRWAAIMGSSKHRTSVVKRSFSGLGEEVQRRKRKILQEISFLEGLVEEMKDDIDDLRYTQQMEAESRTTLGRVKSWLGVLFSVVLLVRLYFAGMSIWQHWYATAATSSSDAVGGATTNKRDPVTTTLLWMLGHHVVSEKKYDELSQFISLLLTAILSFTQVRTFLRTVGAIHRRMTQLFCPSRMATGRLTPRGSDVSLVTAGSFDEQSTHPTGNANNTNRGTGAAFPTRTGVYMYLLALLMGSYCLACIVLTKTMLPWQYRASFSAALGGFDAFNIQSDVINAMFALSAALSATILAMLFGIQKQNAARHNMSWVEDWGSGIGGGMPGRDLDV